MNLCLSIYDILTATCIFFFFFVFNPRREGIQFSLTPIEDPANPGGPPPNLGYLEILTEFSSKLLKLDKKTV